MMSVGLLLSVGSHADLHRFAQVTASWDWPAQMPTVCHSCESGQLLSRVPWTRSSKQSAAPPTMITKIAQGVSS
jgi:hypothetical protein